MVSVTIRDPESKKGVKVNGEGELSAVIHPHPPVNEPVSAVPFVADFADSNGVTDMRVDGSSTNVDYTIVAEQDKDKYIKSMLVIIADDKATPVKFGNITALTNGLIFKWQTIDLGTTVIRDELQSNFDFIRLAQGNPPFGNDAKAFLVKDAVGANSETYMLVVDFASIFGLPWGLRLRKASTDKLIMTVRDDTSPVDEFKMTAYGIKI